MAQAGSRLNGQAPLRIALVHAADIGGGAEAVVMAHHAELLRLGVDARLLVARKHGDSPGVEQMRYVRGPKGLRRMARWWEAATGRQYVYEPSFRALVRDLPAQADVVHLHSLHGSGGYAELPPLVAMAQRVPTVLSLHDLWWLTGHCAHPQECERWKIGCGNCPDLARTPAISRDATRANFRVKQKVAAAAPLHLIVPSQWVRERVAESPILRHLPVTVVNNPIDTAIYKPMGRVEARQRLGLAQDKRILLMAAQFLQSPFKGIMPVLDALAGDAFRDVQLILIGRDSKIVAQRARLPVVSIPFVTDRAAMADYYRAADLLLMPSKVETFGLVAAEAMACGTPVAAFPAGGLGDVVVDGEGGVVTTQDDASAFVSAVAGLLDDPERRSRLSRSAAERVLREFNLEAHSQACLRVYRAHADARSHAVFR